MKGNEITKATPFNLGHWYNCGSCVKLWVRCVKIWVNSIYNYLMRYNVEFLIIVPHKVIINWVDPSFYASDPQFYTWSTIIPVTQIKRCCLRPKLIRLVFRSFCPIFEKKYQIFIVLKKNQFRSTIFITGLLCKSRISKKGFFSKNGNLIFF